MGTAEEGSESHATVLIVEDEEELAALYEVWLSARHDVRVAHNGESGLEKMTADVDVVLLDRRLPGMSGDEVLDAIKRAGYDALVVMVTAVNPDTDIVDLPFDDYVTKPLTRAVMLEIVDRMLKLDRASKAVREYHSLERRRDVLRTASERHGVTDTEAFAQLTTRLEAAAKDAGAGLAWLKNEYYEVDQQ